PESHLPVPMLLEQRPSGNTTPFVVLLDELDGAAGAGALRAGARAVLPRSAAPEEIRAAVRAAAAGLASLPAALAGALLDGTSPDGAGALVDTRDQILTPRERQVLTLLGEGLLNKEIAVQLGISEHTVKTHLAAIYEKLDASNRAEAVARGLRRGLIMLWSGAPEQDPTPPQARGHRVPPALRAERDPIDHTSRRTPRMPA